MGDTAQGGWGPMRIYQGFNLLLNSSDDGYVGTD